MIPSLNQLKKAGRDPSRAVSYFLKPRYRNASVRIASHVPIGTNILTKDWDVCIILDTCRVDALREVADEFGFIDKVGKIWSLGGSSPEWLVHTFDSRWKEVLSSTAYLTANAFSERVFDDKLDPDPAYPNRTIIKRLRVYGDWDPVSSADFGRIENIWEYVSEDHQIDETLDPDGLMPGGAPPRYVTDRAISVARNHNYDRLILHYMQPHAPYLAETWTKGREIKEYEKQPFEYLRRTGDREAVWNGYLRELRYVLDDVELLLRNLDAERVVITADHGEAFGEYGVFNHHTGSLHPHIRFVPWAETSATDTGSYTPEVEPIRKNYLSVEEQLEALGYIS